MKEKANGPLPKHPHEVALVNWLCCNTVYPDKADYDRHRQICHDSLQASAATTESKEPQ
jgi:hypothetical protein